MTDPTIHRMVGESYKLYAERMYGRARAAETERDELRARLTECQESNKAEHDGRYGA